MSKIEELHDNELDLVSGGQITYTWDGSIGTIGINGDNRYILVNKDGFVDFMNEVHGTMSDADILNNLYNMGILRLR